MYLEIGVRLRSRPLLRKREVQICSCWRRRRLTSLTGRSRSGFGPGWVGRPHRFIEQRRMRGAAFQLRRPTSFAGWEGWSLQRLICVTNRFAWGTAPVRQDCLMSFSGNRSRQTVNRSHQVAKRSRQVVNRWHQVANRSRQAVNRSRQVIAVGPQGETTSQRLTASGILRQSDAVF